MPTNPTNQEISRGTDNAGSSTQKTTVATNVAGNTSDKPIVAMNVAGNTTDKPIVAMNVAGNTTDKPTIATNVADNTTDKPAIAMNVAGNTMDKPTVAMNVAGKATNKHTVTINVAGNTTDKPTVAMNVAANTIDKPIVATNISSNTIEKPKGVMNVADNTTYQATGAMNVAGNTANQSTIAINVADNISDKPTIDDNVASKTTDQRTQEVSSIHIKYDGMTKEGESTNLQIDTTSSTSDILGFSKSQEETPINRKTSTPFYFPCGCPETVFYNMYQYIGNETRYSEYKAGLYLLKKHSLTKTIGSYVCGFLNSEGGTLYLGADDDGMVEGIFLDSTQMEHTRLDIECEIRCIHPEVKPEEYSINFARVKERTFNFSRNKRIVEVCVKPRSPPASHYTYKNDIYIRRDGSLQKISKDQHVHTELEQQEKPNVSDKENI